MRDNPNSRKPRLGLGWRPATPQAGLRRDADVAADVVTPKRPPQQRRRRQPRDEPPPFGEAAPWI
jgi:hypothetical protein